MPRYHFDLHDGASSPDLNGLELADLDQAKRQALAMLSEELVNPLGAFWTKDAWKLNVTDERGRDLLCVRFEANEAP